MTGTAQWLTKPCATHHHCQLCARHACDPSQRPAWRCLCQRVVRRSFSPSVFMCCPFLLSVPFLSVGVCCCLVVRHVYRCDESPSCAGIVAFSLSTFALRSVTFTFRPLRWSGSSPLPSLRYVVAFPLAIFAFRLSVTLVNSSSRVAVGLCSSSRAKLMHFGPGTLCFARFVAQTPTSFLTGFRPPPLHRLISRCSAAGFVQLLSLFLLAGISWNTAFFCCVSSAFAHRLSTSTSSQYSASVDRSVLPICTSSLTSSNCLMTSDSSNSIGEGTLPFSSSFNDSLTAARPFGIFFEVVVWGKFRPFLRTCRCWCFGPQR